MRERRRLDHHALMNGVATEPARQLIGPDLGDGDIGLNRSRQSRQAVAGGENVGNLPLRMTLSSVSPSL